jgi:hypothetical protein
MKKIDPLKPFSWGELLLVLGPKAPRKRTKEEERRRTTRRLRTWKRNRADKHAKARFIKSAVDGPAGQARPGVGVRLHEPPRWPLLLKVMEPGREYVLRELIPLYGSLSATHSALEDRLIKRGLAEKRRNPATADALRRSHRKGETNKQFRSPAGIPDAWLYLLTEAGAAYVAADAKQGPPKEALDTRSEIDA